MTDNQIIYNLNASKPLKRNFHRLDIEKRRRIVSEAQTWLMWDDVKAEKLIRKVKREL